MTRRKRKPGASGTATTATNRRRRRTTNPRRTLSTAPNRRRRSNPSRRRRARNPQVKSLVMMAGWAAVGAIATNVIAGFIPIQASGWAGIGIRFGAAYLTGYLAERFVAPQNAQMIAVGGAASAAGEAINMLLGSAKGTFTGMFNSPAPPPPEMADYYLGSGMGDIVPAPDGLGDIVPAPEW